MRDFAFTTQFKKDLKLMEKRHRNMDALLEVMTLIIWDESLPEKYREHNLSGTWEGFTDSVMEKSLSFVPAPIPMCSKPFTPF